jgi:hypothetical protein
VSTSNPACTWSKTSSAPWLTVTSPTQSAISGEAAVIYAVAANTTTTSSRTATISITDASGKIGATFTVTQAGNPHPVPSTISGVVTSTTSTATTPVPITGATVTIGSSKTTTASNGSYSISGLSGGAATVTVTAANYTTSSSNITISGNQSLNLTLTPILYSVSGYIYDGEASKADTPLSGATVTIGGETVTTGTTGSYSITGLTAGSYSVTVVKTGYITYLGQPFSVSSNMTDSLTLKPIVSTVSGVVTSAAGTPLSGVTVTLGSAKVTTNSTGSYSFTGLLNGSYTLTATASYYNTDSTSVTVSGSNVTNANLSLTPTPYTVSGYIYDGAASKANTPLAGATVTIGSETMTTGANGSYSITGPTHGTYTMTVSKTGYVSSSKSFSLTANTTTTLTLAPVTYTVSGVIHSGSTTGPGLAGATVTIDGKTATTASNGSFSIAAITSGTYTYTVTKSGYVNTNGSVAMTQNQTISASLTPITYTLTGTVRSRSTSGAVVANATVQINGQTLTTNASGVFSAAGLTAGTYSVSITAKGYVAYKATVTVSANASQTFCLTP